MSYFKKESLLSDKALILYFVAIKFIITLIPYQYGIFRDEFLYISMSSHPGLGYLEVPPLSPLILIIVKAVIGVSPFSMHLITATTGSIFIIITGMIVKKIDGGRFSLILALICVTFAPQYIGTDAHFDYNSFDKLFWALALYFITVLIITGDKNNWVYFGIAAGFGILSKITIIYLGFGVILAFLLTKDRRLLIDKRLIFGGLAAFTISLPYLAWQYLNGFPVVEYFINYRTKLYQASIAESVATQIMTMSPLAVTVWAAGLYYFLFDRDGKKYRVFGLAYIIIALVFTLQKAKFYLITPYYAVLFAGGAAYLSSVVKKYDMMWLKRFLAESVIISGLISMPLARPLLPPEIFIKYARLFGMGDGGIKAESSYKTSSLPQYFADQFGWEEMVRKIAGVYKSLSDDEKKKVCIFARNYGEAGAIHYYRNKYGLPDPICSHNIHYFWGPGSNTGDLVIVVGINENDRPFLERNFNSVVEADRIYSKYGMPQENNPVYLCRGLHEPLKDFWKKIKLFI